MIKINIEELRKKFTEKDKHPRDQGYYGHSCRTKETDQALEAFFKKKYNEKVTPETVIPQDWTEEKIDLILNSRIARLTMDSFLNDEEAFDAEEFMHQFLCYKMTRYTLRDIIRTSVLKGILHEGEEPADYVDGIEEDFYNKRCIEKDYDVI